MDLIMQKTNRFGSHFEFRHFTNLKHPLMQKITPDSDSTPNLAIEKLGFVYYFEKRFECAHPYHYTPVYPLCLLTANTSTMLDWFTFWPLLKDLYRT